MMEHFLTKQTFRSGLTNYLNTQKYRAAEQDDLWEHLTEQGHKVSKENSTVLYVFFLRYF